jgi:hypothetical protein
MSNQSGATFISLPSVANSHSATSPLALAPVAVGELNARVCGSTASGVAPVGLKTTELSIVPLFQKVRRHAESTQWHGPWRLLTRASSSCIRRQRE